jgi:hypothetical protein
LQIEKETQMNEQDKPAEWWPVPSSTDLDDAELESVSGGASFYQNGQLSGHSCIG